MKILSDEQRRALLSRTAYSLPDNPSANQRSASQIKKKLYEGIMILFDWLKETQIEFNSAIEEFNKTNDLTYNHCVDLGNFNKKDGTTEDNIILFIEALLKHRESNSKKSVIFTGSLNSNNKCFAQYDSVNRCFYVYLTDDDKDTNEDTMFKGYYVHYDEDGELEVVLATKSSISDIRKINLLLEGINLNSDGVISDEHKEVDVIKKVASINNGSKTFYNSGFNPIDNTVSFTSIEPVENGNFKLQILKISLDDFSVTYNSPYESSTYATLVYVQEEISKLSDIYLTIENANDTFVKKTEGITSNNTIIEDEIVVGEDGERKVKTSGFTIAMLIEIINGKRDTHVVDSIDDAFCYSNVLPSDQETYPASFSYPIDDTSVVKVDGETVLLTELITGDVILSVQESEPDFFVNVSTATKTITFYKLETDVGNLVDYLTIKSAENTYLKKVDAFSKNYNDLIDKPIRSNGDDSSLEIVDEKNNIAVRIDENGLESFNLRENGKNLQDKYLLKDSIFTGTQAEYEQAVANGSIAVGTIVYLIDEEEETTTNTSAVLGTAVLGYMILG